MVHAHVRNTAVASVDMITADDGYCSRAGREQLLRSFGADTVVSFSGRKGKRLLGEATWSSDLYGPAPSLRASTESGIFVLKSSFELGSLRRCGHLRVHGELFEKALAYNLCCAAFLRARDRDALKERAPGSRLTGYSLTYFRKIPPGPQPHLKSVSIVLGILYPACTSSTIMAHSPHTIKPNGKASKLASLPFRTSTSEAEWRSCSCVRPGVQERHSAALRGSLRTCFQCHRSSRRAPCTNTATLIPKSRRVW